MSVVLILGPIVPTRCDPPRPTGRGFVFGEVELPDLIRARGFGREGGLAAFGEFATFTLIVVGKNQSFVPQETQHRRLRDAVAVMAGHRPNFAVSPRRMRPRVLESNVSGRVSCGPGPVSYTHLRAHETVLDLVCR